MYKRIIYLFCFMLLVPSLYSKNINYNLEPNNPYLPTGLPMTEREYVLSYTDISTAESSSSVKTPSLEALLFLSGVCVFGGLGLIVGGAVTISKDKTLGIVLLSIGIVSEIIGIYLFFNSLSRLAYLHKPQKKPFQLSDEALASVTRKMKYLDIDFKFELINCRF